MPVEDRPPHELTQRTTGTPYGCFDKGTVAGGYYMPIRIYQLNGNFTMGTRFIKHTMSVGCRYDKSRTDPRCEGCIRTGEGEDYAADQSSRSAIDSADSR